MSPIIQRVQNPPLLPTTTQFPKHLYCLRCFSAWCLFALDDLWNGVVCLQPHSLLIRKVWVPVMHFCPCLQRSLERGQDARIVQIEFSATFDRVNHQGILYKLCSVGIGGSALSILIQFLSDQSQA